MVALLLAEGFEEIEALTPLDLLRRAEIEIESIGVNNQTVIGAHGIPVQCDRTLSELSESPTMVILPGGMPGARNLAQSSAVARLIKQIAAQDGIIAAICAAPALVLAPLGLLEHSRYTCFPAYRQQIQSGTLVDKPVVVDNNLITAPAAGCAVQFALALIERIRGAETAHHISRSILHYGTQT